MPNYRTLMEGLTRLPGLSRGWRTTVIVGFVALCFLYAWPMPHVSRAASTESLWTERHVSDNPIPTLQQLNDALIMLTQQLLPSVVSIRIYGSKVGTELPKNHPPTPEGRPPYGTGSGFIIRADGLIVTNQHVVENGTDIEVQLYDGGKYAAKVLGQDPIGDVALLRIEVDEPLPVAPFGSSSDLQVGEFVVAIGSPFGFEHTTTFGIVSGKRRQLLHSGVVGGFIQTDASINTGNSGGPLVNMRGEVIGINTVTVGRGELGFAIPIDAVKAVLHDLHKGATPARGWLGVQIRPVEPSKARQLGLSSHRGAYVQDVLNDQPAQRGGIQPGDIIVRFGNLAIDSPLDLQSAVAGTPVGRKVKVQVYRKRALHTVELIVGTMPSRQ